MKVFVLIMTLYLLILSIKDIFQMKTKKEQWDKLINKESNKELTTSSIKDELVGSCIIAMIIIIVYINMCISIIDIPVFALIGGLYIVWTIYDSHDFIKYLTINEYNKIYNSKIYEAIDNTFDIGFSIYILYSVLSKW